MSTLNLTRESLHGAKKPSPEDAEGLLRYVANRVGTALYETEDLVVHGELSLDQSDADIRLHASLAAFDLVASWGLALRLRPGWLDLERFRARVDTLLNRKDFAIQKLAASEVTPHIWREHTDEWLGAREEADEAEREEEAYEILKELDEMLIVAALIPAFIDDTISRDVEACRDHFIANVDALIDARKYICESSLGIDPMLAERHPLLCEAARPLWEPIVERASRTPLSLASDSRYPTRENPFERAWEMLKALGDAAVEAALGSLELPAPKVAHADASPRSERPPVRWRGIGTDWSAELTMLSVDRAIVSFRGVVPPAGSRIICVGVFADLQRIGQFGKALFDYDDLRFGNEGAGAVPSLIVLHPDGTVDVGQRVD